MDLVMFGPEDSKIVGFAQICLHYWQAGRINIITKKPSDQIICHAKGLFFYAESKTDIRI